MMVGEARLLAAVGISADEERVYRALLTYPGSGSTELREHTGLGLHRLRRALDELERRAMVTRRGGTPIRFQPAAPDVVVEALVSTREEELTQTRLGVGQLMALVRTPPEQLVVTELVEILTSREAVAQRLVQLQQATREAIEGFSRPPYAQSTMDEHEPLQEILLRRGVAIRAVYDEDALRYAGQLENVTRMARLGEQARVVTELPLKLALFDRRTALVPISQTEPEGAVEGGLIVHKCALLDALVALFTIYWERGTDVRLPITTSEAGPRAADERTVLTLLAAGLKDEAIARRLGVSKHTVRRRINAILQRLGVTTRFQLGLALGRQGGDVPASSAS
ncbi:MAG: helix-turn-helix transcriptional regulator [Acidimicrobiales bacterium]